MTRLPTLYPNHRHRWVDHPVDPNKVCCTVCGFDPPRNAAQLDGESQPCRHCGNPNHTAPTCPQKATT